MAEKILIVEDELTLQETLAYNLKKQGYLVESANDGPSAIVNAKQYQPDLILLDIMLPGMDGFEVCRILRKDMLVPILMLTARDDEIGPRSRLGSWRGRLPHPNLSACAS